MSLRPSSNNFFNSSRSLSTPSWERSMESLSPKPFSKLRASKSASFNGAISSKDSCGRQNTEEGSTCSFYPKLWRHLQGNHAFNLKAKKHPTSSWGGRWKAPAQNARGVCSTSSKTAAAATPSSFGMAGTGCVRTGTAKDWAGQGTWTGRHASAGSRGPRSTSRTWTLSSTKRAATYQRDHLKEGQIQRQGFRFGWCNSWPWVAHACSTEACVKNKHCLYEWLKWKWKAVIWQWLHKLSLLGSPAWTWSAVISKFPSASKAPPPPASSRIAMLALSMPCAWAALACKASRGVLSLLAARMDCATWFPVTKCLFGRVHWQIKLEQPCTSLQRQERHGIIAFKQAMTHKPRLPATISEHHHGWSALNAAASRNAHILCGHQHKCALSDPSKASAH